MPPIYVDMYACTLYVCASININIADKLSTCFFAFFSLLLTFIFQTFDQNRFYKNQYEQKAFFYSPNMQK